MKGGTKILVRVAICIMLLSISVSGCFEDEKEKKSNNDLSYEFLIIIESENDGEYNLIVPIPINQNGSESQINDYLEIIKGKGTFNIVITKYGYALNITSDSSISLQSKGNNKLDIELEHEKPKTQLSLLYDENNNSIMDEYDDVKYWFYLNSTNNKSLNVKLSLNIVKSRNSDFTEIFCYIDDELLNGWQKIEGRKMYQTT
jgi:hypothetical protein